MLALAQLFHGGREGIFFDVGENDFHPFLSEAFGEGTAHATGSAGDDGDLVFEGVHASPLFVGGEMLERVAGEIVGTNVARELVAGKGCLLSEREPATLKGVEEPFCRRASSHRFRTA